MHWKERVGQAGKHQWEVVSQSVVNMDMSKTGSAAACAFLLNSGNFLIYCGCLGKYVCCRVERIRR